MDSLLILGIILLLGFLLGELGALIKLPKVSGYILAGIFLNPTLTHIIPIEFIKHTKFPIDISLAIIAFSVGGALSFTRLKELGKSVFFITFFEAQTALLLTALGFILVLGLFPGLGFMGMQSTIIPLAILLGTMACPTDPSATLAVAHEYNAKGRISSTILSVAGLDDVIGLINFTIGTSIVVTMLGHQTGTIGASILYVVYSLVGAFIVGTVSALLMMLEDCIFKRENEGAHIVIILSILITCFGVSSALKVDSLFACMVMGAIIVNFSKLSSVAFQLLERYTDELVFVLFFTLSAMHLDFSSLRGVFLLIILFVLLRFAGKILGTILGGKLSGLNFNDSLKIGFGFIPQGGIVIGLALIAGQNKVFNPFSNALVAIVIGGTIIHELIGPILSAASIKSAGEFQKTKAET